MRLCVACGCVRAVCARSGVFDEGPRLLDFGSRLGRWQKKCLQVAVAGARRGSAQDAVRTRMLRACCNNRASGLAGGAEEARNFHRVRQVLRSVGRRVRVLDVQCVDDFWDGLWLGAWNLGSAGGTLLGTFVWSRSEEHVFDAECDGMQTWLAASDSC